MFVRKCMLFSNSTYVNDDEICALMNKMRLLCLCLLEKNLHNATIIVYKRQWRYVNESGIILSFTVTYFPLICLFMFFCCIAWKLQSEDKNEVLILVFNGSWCIYRILKYLFSDLLWNRFLFSFLRKFCHRSHEMFALTLPESIKHVLVELETTLIDILS